MGQAHPKEECIGKSMPKENYQNFLRVLEKIKHAPVYADYSSEEQIRLAKRLTDPRKLRKHYLKTSFTSIDPPKLVCFFIHQKFSY